MFNRFFIFQIEYYWMFDRCRTNHVRHRQTRPCGRAENGERRTDIEQIPHKTHHPVGQNQSTTWQTSKARFLSPRYFASNPKTTETVSISKGDTMGCTWNLLDDSRYAPASWFQLALNCCLRDLLKRNGIIFAPPHTVGLAYRVSNRLRSAKSWNRIDPG